MEPPSRLPATVDSSMPQEDNRDPSEQPRDVEVRYEHSPGLTNILTGLGLSLIITTYQAGRVITVGVHDNRIQIRFTYVPQAMGLTRTPSGLAIGSFNGVWTLPASLDIAPNLSPAGCHDIAFLARSFHQTGPVLGHDLAWCDGQLWLVNTLFNCLCTLQAPWSFIPQWHPAFINTITAEDRCHLNGLAINMDGRGPAFVTAHGTSNDPGGWRPNKVDGGCLLDVASGEIILKGLSMPHSPRLHNNKLYLLNSGCGQLLECSTNSRRVNVLAQLPGFTRGLDCHGSMAIVGLSRIRESAVFGGLPIAAEMDELRCGIAFVDLDTGEIIEHLWFLSGVEEIYSTVLIPGYLNPAILGPDSMIDKNQTVWLVPPLGKTDIKHLRPSTDSTASCTDP